jgi:predicted RNase H-like nuclease
MNANATNVNEGSVEPIPGGLDGCPGGWVLVIGPQGPQGNTDVVPVGEFADVIAMVDAGRPAAVGIDIPIGLPESGSRRCDIEARKLIGPRRSSVFPAPARALLGAETYAEAITRSRAASSKAISRQTFGILGKIREVDLEMTSNRQRTCFEVHPELCFTVLAGAPMVHRKVTAEGRAERLKALRTVFSDVDRHATRRIAGTHPDDVLDAFAAAWSARRWLQGSHIQLGGDLDQRGLRMEVIA